ADDRSSESPGLPDRAAARLRVGDVLSVAPPGAGGDRDAESAVSPRRRLARPPPRRLRPLSHRRARHPLRAHRARAGAARHADSAATRARRVVTAARAPPCVFMYLLREDVVVEIDRRTRWRSRLEIGFPKAR